MSKHTPGPWIAYSFSDMPYPAIMQDINGKTGKGIVKADGWCNIFDRAKPETQANARLIAAAPEMLATLELSLGREDIADSAIGDVIREIIRKARGE